MVPIFPPALSYICTLPTTAPQTAAAIFGDLEELSVKVVMRKLSRGVVRRTRSSSTKGSVVGAAAGLKTKPRKGEGVVAEGGCAMRVGGEILAVTDTEPSTNVPSGPTTLQARASSRRHLNGRWRRCDRNGSHRRCRGTSRHCQGRGQRQARAEEACAGRCVPATI